MLLGYLMVGVLGGLTAIAASLAAGQPVWVAALLYMLVGNLAWITALLVHVMWDLAHRPARPLRAAAAPMLRPVRVGR